MKDLAADLKRASAILAAADPTLLYIADAWAIWIGARDSVTFEDAVGVARNCRSARRRRRRDAIYIEIARTFFPNLTGLPCAREIVTAIDHYQTSTWRHDRDNCRRPAGANGLIFDLLSLGEHLLDAGTLRKLPGIFNAFENQTSVLRLDEEEGNCREHDDKVFEGSDG